MPNWFLERLLLPYQEFLTTLLTPTNLKFLINDNTSNTFNIINEQDKTLLTV